MAVVAHVARFLAAIRELQADRPSCLAAQTFPSQRTTFPFFADFGCWLEIGCDEFVNRCHTASSKSQTPAAILSVNEELRETFPVQSRPLPMDLRTIPARLGGSEQNAGQSMLVDPSRPKPDAFLVSWQSQSWIADHRACLYLTTVSCREVGDRSMGSGRFGIFGLIF